MLYNIGECVLKNISFVLNTDQVKDKACKINKCVVVKLKVWVGFVPYVFRNWTQSRCPYISAILTGLSPQQSSVSMGAWSECSSRSTASLPDSAAKCAGVHPCSVLRQGLAPWLMRTRTVSVYPVGEVLKYNPKCIQMGNFIQVSNEIKVKYKFSEVTNVNQMAQAGNSWWHSTTNNCLRR